MDKNKSRISWEEYALRLAEVAAQRSEDPYVKVGACILRWDNSVASLGYNGVPAGIEIDWSDRDLRRPYIVHSEQNALRYIKPGEARLIAITLQPCSSCLTNIASYGIKEVIFRDYYDKDNSSIELAAEFGISIKQLK